MIAGPKRSVGGLGLWYILDWFTCTVIRGGNYHEWAHPLVRELKTDLGGGEGDQNPIARLEWVGVSIVTGRIFMGGSVTHQQGNLESCHVTVQVVHNGRANCFMWISTGNQGTVPITSLWG